MNWHPIETIPKDGTPVLVWFSDGEYWPACYDTNTDEEAIEMGFVLRLPWSSLPFSGEYRQALEGATHWSDVEPPGDG